MGMSFLVLSVISLTNLITIPETLTAYADFSAHLLANSVFNVPQSRDMDVSIIPGYVSITSAINYLTASILREGSWTRFVVFILTILLVSTVVSVAATSSYLTS